MLTELLIPIKRFCSLFQAITVLKLIVCPHFTIFKASYLLKPTHHPMPLSYLILTLTMAINSTPPKTTQPDQTRLSLPQDIDNSYVLIFTNNLTQHA